MKQQNISAKNTILIAYKGKKYKHNNATGNYYSTKTKLTN